MTGRPRGTPLAEGFGGDDNEEEAPAEPHSYSIMADDAQGHPSLRHVVKPEVSAEV